MCQTAEALCRRVSFFALSLLSLIIIIQRTAQYVNSKTDNFSVSFDIIVRYSQKLYLSAVKIRFYLIFLMIFALLDGVLKTDLTVCQQGT